MSVASLIKNVHHTALSVRDYDATRAFLVDFLGFEVEGEIDRREEEKLGVVVGLPGAVIRWALLRLTAETLAMARKAGINTDAAVEVLQNTTAGRGQINVNYPNKVLNGDVTPDFPLFMGDKDISLGALHRIELPCHGRSPNRVPRDFASLAAEMRHALDALNTGPCYLVGHSLGGALALALADARPRKIESLTLIAPAGLGSDINGDILSGMLRASRSESLGPWMKLLTSDPGAMGWSFVQAAAVLRRDPEARIMAFRASMSSGRFEPVIMVDIYQKVPPAARTKA